MRVALALLLPVLAAAQTLDVAEILRRSDQAGDINGPKSQLYAYREYVVQSELDKNGKETDRRTETWDVIGLEGSSYRKLILRDEKALSSKEQKSEDKRLADETKKRRKENAQGRNRTFSLSYSLGFNRESRRVFDASYAGEETVNGRPAYVIEFTPKASYQPVNDNEKELQHYRVKNWIDKETLNDAKFELAVIRQGSRMQPGSVFTFTSRPLDDGVWIMTESQARFELRVFKVAGGRGTTVTTRSDFHRFEATSRIVDDAQ